MQSAVGAECSSSPVAVSGPSAGAALSARQAERLPGRGPGQEGRGERGWLAVHRPQQPDDASRIARRYAEHPWNRSPAQTRAAWAFRNWPQVGPSRRGAGSRPARLRMSRTVPGGTPIPAPAELAADPLVSPGGVLARQAQHRGADVCPGEGAAWTFPRIGPRAGDQDTGASTAGSPGSRRSSSTAGEAAAATAQPAASDPIVDVWPVHLAGWHGDLVAQRDDLDLVGAFTTPGQDYELEDAVEG
jgi:hypothetical protein